MQKNQLTDEQLDVIVRTLVKDARLGDDALDSIADAPQLWWGVQRNIVGPPTAARRGWLSLLDWRIAVFASVALIGALAIGLLSNRDDSLSVAGVRTAPTTEIATVRDDSGSPDVAVTQVRPAPVAATQKRQAVRRPVPAQARNVTAKTAETPELKSEFIALMYNSESDSGQLVKVKVPRSMMVSLGVSTNVQGNSDFVNAEVLMGNDGSARAIRFIQ